MPQNRIAAAFGSYGWAGAAVKSVESVLKEAGIEIAQPSYVLIWGGLAWINTNARFAVTYTTRQKETRITATRRVPASKNCRLIGFARSAG